MQSVALIIPAYNPTDALIKLVEQVSQDFPKIIVVDDGSNAVSKEIFRKLRGIVLVEHIVNLGKGAALKTGMNAALTRWPDLVGVVTADADGQHLRSDIVCVAGKLIDNPKNLILGSRALKSNVPLRSFIGNRLTAVIFRILVGTWLTDTQSGLRGIPRDLCKILLRIKSNSYEFELDMLIYVHRWNWGILPVPIQTVYLDENKSSHFNPLLDSARIYFVFIRFLSSSLLTGIVDYVVFVSSFFATQNILLSTAYARGAGTLVNFSINKNIVFRSKGALIPTFIKYLLLVIVLGGASYALIQILIEYFGMSVLASKLTAEIVLYLANFAIQRDFIFTYARRNS